MISFFFFFNDTATTEIYTLSLHDALPISTTVDSARRRHVDRARGHRVTILEAAEALRAKKVSALELANESLARIRSEEHTSELQSRPHLVCRLLLEKKKKQGRDEKDNDEN